MSPEPDTGKWTRIDHDTHYEYVLNEDLWHTTNLPCPAGFESQFLAIRIVDTLRGNPLTGVLVRANYKWDGATGVRDTDGTVAASCFHDALYEWSERIAATWGWSERKVLRWADEVFFERMRQDGAGRVRRNVYYAGVRLFGSAFHRIAGWF